MLDSISFTNFKSYHQASLPLSPLTMLIGANASGKSNAIEGLRLLSWLAQGNRLSAIRSVMQGSNPLIRGRIQDLGCHGQSAFTLACSLWHPDLAVPLGQLTITMQIREGDDLHVVEESMEGDVLFRSSRPLYEVTQPASGMGGDLQVAYNNFAKGGKKPILLCSDQFAVFTQLDSPARFRKHHTQPGWTITQATARFRQWLSGILFLDPIPSRMRGYSFKSEKQLQGNGEQLSSVLFHLWGGNQAEDQITQAERDHRNTLLNFVRSLPEQEIQGMGFLTGPRDEVMVTLAETFGGQTREFDASLLSDGTLRVLAIAAAMLSAPEGSLVVIEEIDNGVHPSRATLLLEQIADLAKQRHLRILLSSHNPALLDALPVRAIPDVVFCYRDPQAGGSRLVRLQDAPDYPELIAQGGIGHLMTTGVLERFIKFHPGPGEKKRRALAWLAELQQSTRDAAP